MPLFAHLFATAEKSTRLRLPWHTHTSGGQAVGFRVLRPSLDLPLQLLLDS